MFVVLDTNHFREMTEKTSVGRNLERRIDEHQADVFTCIVAVEETVQGWLAVINRCDAGRKQVAAYGRLHRNIEALIKLPILPFDDAAASVFHRLRDARVRVGTMRHCLRATSWTSRKSPACAWKTGSTEWKVAQRVPPVFSVGNSSPVERTIVSQKRLRAPQRPSQRGGEKCVKRDGEAAGEVDEFRVTDPARLPLDFCDGVAPDVPTEESALRRNRYLPSGIITEICCRLFFR